MKNIITDQRDVPLEEFARFAQIDISDSEVGPIWINFKSRSGKLYTAVHVFHHLQGPHILLFSRDKDRVDFVMTTKIFEKEMRVKGDAEIADRTDDICATLNFLYRPKKLIKLMNEKIELFYKKNFADVRIFLIYKQME